MDSKQAILAIADALRSRYPEGNFEITSIDNEVLVKGVPEEMKTNITSEITALISEMARSYSFDATQFPLTQQDGDIHIAYTQ